MPTEIVALAAFTYVFCCTLIAGSLAWDKNRGALVGAAWGFFLGIIGVLIVATLSRVEPSKR